MTMHCLILIAAGLVGQGDSTGKAEPFVIASPIEGRVTIAAVVPDGTFVHAGEVVAELDAGGLRDQLVAQRQAVDRAQAAVEAANVARAKAETVAGEAEGRQQNGLVASQGAVELAQSDLTRAKDRLEWSTKMVEKGFVSNATKVADRLTLDRASLELDQARAALDRSKRDNRGGFSIRQAEIAVARARERCFERRGRLDAERAQLEKLRRQVLQCSVLAPFDGNVRLARPGTIEVGATVVEDQPLLTIEPR